MLLRSNFSSFPQHFQYKSNYIFILFNVVVRYIIFLKSANLIRLGTDISNGFRESLGIRDTRVDCTKCYKQSMLLIQTISSGQVWLYLQQGSVRVALRKYACSNILRILPPKKKKNFQRKNSVSFHISAQNIDCGYLLELSRRGGSNEYPQSMFLSRNKKSNVYFCKPQFHCIKVGFKGVKTI